MLNDPQQNLKFTQFDNGTYEFAMSAVRVYIICLEKTCSCTHFHKYAMCYHYAAVAILERLGLRGMPVVRALVNRGRKRVEEDLDDPRLALL